MAPRVREGYVKDEKKNLSTPGQPNVTTVTTETVEPRKFDPAVDLTPEEEKVVRMLHGKSLDGRESLEFASGSEETKLKLAMIEAHLIDMFQADALEADPSTGAPRSVLADKI